MKEPVADHESLRADFRAYAPGVAHLERQLRGHAVAQATDLARVGHNRTGGVEDLEAIGQRARKRVRVPASRGADRERGRVSLLGVVEGRHERRRRHLQRRAIGRRGGIGSRADPDGDVGVAD